MKTILGFLLKSDFDSDFSKVNRLVQWPVMSTQPWEKINHQGYAKGQREEIENPMTKKSQSGFCTSLRHFYPNGSEAEEGSDGGGTHDAQMWPLRDKMTEWGTEENMSTARVLQRGQCSRNRGGIPVNNSSFSVRCSSCSRHWLLWKIQQTLVTLHWRT